MDADSRSGTRRTARSHSRVKWPATGAFGVVFSPDGKRLATANWDSAVRILDATTGREITLLKVPGLDGNRPSVTCVAFSPDGQRLVSGGDDKVVRLWDPTTGQEILTLTGHTGKVNGVAFSPDGKRVVTVCGDTGQRSPGTVKIWDATTGQEILAPVVPTRDRNRPAITSVAFSPDGNSWPQALPSTCAQRANLSAAKHSSGMRPLAR